MSDDEIDEVQPCIPKENEVRRRRKLKTLSAFEIERCNALLTEGCLAKDLKKFLGIHPRTARKLVTEFHTSI